jgi:hypothetical protein
MDRRGKCHSLARISHTAAWRACKFKSDGHFCLKPQNTLFRAKPVRIAGQACGGEMIRASRAFKN